MSWFWLKNTKTKIEKKRFMELCFCSFFASIFLFKNCRLSKRNIKKEKTTNIKFDNSASCFTKCCIFCQKERKAHSLKLMPPYHVSNWRAYLLMQENYHRRWKTKQHPIWQKDRSVKDAKWKRLQHLLLPNGPNCQKKLKMPFAKEKYF